MPRIRPGWTPTQSIYFRIAAIEYLWACHTGQRGKDYLDMFVTEWMMIYGVPQVEEGTDADATLRLYKARIITTIKWHAFAGREVLKCRPEARIRALKSRLCHDLFYIWDDPNCDRELVPFKARPGYLATAIPEMAVRFEEIKL